MAPPVQPCSPPSWWPSVSVGPVLPRISCNSSLFLGGFCQLRYWSEGIADGGLAGGSMPCVHAGGWPQGGLVLQCVTLSPIRTLENTTEATRHLRPPLGIGSTTNTCRHVGLSIRLWHSGVWAWTKMGLSREQRRVQHYGWRCSQGSQSWELVWWWMSCWRWWFH
jgi:hypothetical protein